MGPYRATHQLQLHGLIINDIHEADHYIHTPHAVLPEDMNTKNGNHLNSKHLHASVTIWIQLSGIFFTLIEYCKAVKTLLQQIAEQLTQTRWWPVVVKQWGHNSSFYLLPLPIIAWPVATVLLYTIWPSCEYAYFCGHYWVIFTVMQRKVFAECLQQDPYSLDKILVHPVFEEGGGLWANKPVKAPLLWSRLSPKLIKNRCPLVYSTFSLKP